MSNKFVWTEKYSVNVAEIDEQHKEFINICNDLLTLAESETFTKEEALIIPPYIREFRALSNRQVFISEKLDGNNAPHNRKYATLYLERFHAITKGLSYDDFEGIVFGGGQTYSKMRKQFLSLNKNNIEEISNKFPNHNYLVTEVNHSFQFPVVYKNNDFIIYDIN